MAPSFSDPPKWTSERYIARDVHLERRRNRRRLGPRSLFFIALGQVAEHIDEMSTHEEIKKTLEGVPSGLLERIWLGLCKRQKGPSFNVWRAFRDILLADVGEGLDEDGPHRDVPLSLWHYAAQTELGRDEYASLCHCIEPLHFLDSDIITHLVLGYTAPSLVTFVDVHSLPFLLRNLGMLEIRHWPVEFPPCEELVRVWSLQPNIFPVLRALKFGRGCPVDHGVMQHLSSPAFPSLVLFSYVKSVQGEEVRGFRGLLKCAAGAAVAWRRFLEGESQALEAGNFGARHGWSFLVSDPRIRKFFRTSEDQEPSPADRDWLAGLQMWHKTKDGEDGEDGEDGDNGDDGDENFTRSRDAPRFARVRDVLGRKPSSRTPYEELFAKAVVPSSAWKWWFGWSSRPGPASPLTLHAGLPRTGNELNEERFKELWKVWERAKHGGFDFYDTPHQVGDASDLLEYSLLGQMCADADLRRQGVVSRYRLKLSCLILPPRPLVTLVLGDPGSVGLDFVAYSFIRTLPTQPCPPREGPASALQGACRRILRRASKTLKKGFRRVVSIRRKRERDTTSCDSSGAPPAIDP